MGTSISLKKKVYVCYYYSNNMDIELLRKKINKEGFQAITGRNEIMPGERILSVSESITKCDYFVLIISDEFSQYMREEYNTALKYEKSVMVFIKSELYGDGEINKEFKDRLVTLWDNETELSMKIIETMVGLRYKYPVRGYALKENISIRWLPGLSEKLFSVESRTVEEDDFFFDCIERIESMFTSIPTAQKLEKRIKGILDNLNSLDAIL